MPRIAKNSLAQELSGPAAPRLIVLNSSTSDGRYSQMLRIRPTLLARVRSLSVGPMYIIIEKALEDLCDKLEAMPAGTMATINAAEMDPSHADREMLATDSIPRPRGERASKRGRAKVKAEQAKEAAHDGPDTPTGDDPQGL